MLTGTFSIVARCSKEGSLGVAVATAIPGAGAICPFVSRHGAISTQSFNNYYFGIDGLTHLGEGLSAGAVGENLLRGDPGRERRQVLIVDATGASWAFTGSQCVGEKGHLLGSDYVVAGNMLSGGEVLTAMVDSFEASTSSGAALSDRLMQVLEAGQAEGGDKRGKQSAALKVLGPQSLVPLCDLRVDEHHDPVRELRRVFEVAKRDLLPFMASMPNRRRLEGSLTPELSERLGASPAERAKGLR